MNISVANLERWIYANTSFTSTQAKQFCDNFSSDQLWEIIALIESAYEAGFDDGKKSAEVTQ